MLVHSQIGGLLGRLEAYVTPVCHTRLYMRYNRAAKGMGSFFSGQSGLHYMLGAYTGTPWQRREGWWWRGGQKKCQAGAAPAGGAAYARVEA